MVERLPHHPKVKGSYPTAAVTGGRTGKNIGWFSIKFNNFFSDNDIDTI
jgi:hypothetical protein